MGSSGSTRCDDHQPLVSVIVPCWNSQDTLLETLESVAAQTYRNIEIVIVDDGSSDGSAAVAADFCAQEPRARLVRQENRGLGGARNRGIAESFGTWIAPIDADDVWHPRKIEKQMSTVRAAAEEPGLAYCLYRDIDGQGRVIGSGPSWVFNGAALMRLAYESAMHTIVSRKAVDAVGGFDERLQAAEDVLMNLRIARYFPVAATPEYLIGYRIRREMEWRGVDLMIDSWRTVMRRVVSEGAHIPPYVLRWVEGHLNKILAEERLGRRQYLQALKHILIAIGYDPVRWGAYVLYRVARTIARLIRGRRLRPERVPFSAIDPEARLGSDPDELLGFAKLLMALDAKRLERLAAQERLDRTPG